MRGSIRSGSQWLAGKSSNVVCAGGGTVRDRISKACDFPRENRYAIT
ncbi:MAG: hypothetical protein VKN72_27550 [Nostocales cyanobacterium 94392]|nr:hypothetical protein [Nostocales cyanobacterium 94392]